MRVERDKQTEKVYFYTHDPMLTMLYTEQEAIGLFGDCLEKSDLVPIPAPLLERYEKNMAELKLIQAELKAIRNKS